MHGDVNLARGCTDPVSLSGRSPFGMVGHCVQTEEPLVPGTNRMDRNQLACHRERLQTWALSFLSGPAADSLRSNTGAPVGQMVRVGVEVGAVRAGQVCAPDVWTRA